jgi:hypothetical protein
MAVIPTTWEAYIGRSQSEANRAKNFKTLAEK